MGQLESLIQGKDEQESNKIINADLASNADVEIVDTDNETRFKTIMKNFSLAEHNHKDQYLGNVEVFRCFHNKNFRIYLKEVFTKSEEELHEQMLMWEKRMIELQHPNLIQLHEYRLIQENSVNYACCHSKIESFCATFYKVFMIFDSVETDLLSSIRKDKIPGFQEDELWFILDSLVGALEYMEERELSHQSLRLDTIYTTINHKNIKLFKLADSQLMGYMSNYETQLDKFDKYIYLSPLLFQQYGNKIQNPVHNEYKSDVFTLGLLFIHLSLFESCADLYSLVDHTINSQLLHAKLNRIGQVYSNDFVQIITEMVLLEERYRPDFRSLDRKLSSCPKLFGRRICEMVQVPNLYKMKPASFMSDQEIEMKKQQELKKKQIKDEKDQKEKELTEKDIIIKAIQQQDALNIIKESIAKTSYLTEQLFRQSQRADVQFQVDNIMLNPSQRLHLNDPSSHQIPQMNFIDQQHQVMMGDQTKTIQGIYTDQPLQQTNNQQNNKQFKNYEIPFTSHSPNKVIRPNAGHNINSSNNINQANNVNQQIFTNNLNNFGGQQQQTQHNQQNHHELNDQNQFQMSNRYSSPPKNQGEHQNLSPGKQGEMLTSTSKQLFTENPELPKIIDQNLIRQTIKYKNGNIYEGDILEGKKHGYGIFIFSNQQKYEGEWKYNKRNGKGTQFFQNGQVKYEGQWQEDYYHGFGTLFNKEPKLPQQQMQQYQQQIQNGMSQLQIQQLQQVYLKQIQQHLHQDLIVFPDFWVKYEGDFKNGKKEGFGTMTYNNQDYFVGQFINGQANGTGNYMLGDGSECITGEWQNDKLIKKF